MCAKGGALVFQAAPSSPLLSFFCLSCVRHWMLKQLSIKINLRLIFLKKKKKKKNLSLGKTERNFTQLLPGHWYQKPERHERIKENIENTCYIIRVLFSLLLQLIELAVPLQQITCQEGVCCSRLAAFWLYCNIYTIAVWSEASC